MDKILMAKAGDGNITLYMDGKGIDDHFGSVSKDKAFAYAKDHLGSVLNTEVAGERKIFGTSGERLAKGSVHTDIHSEPVLYGFTGRQLDPESGLYYYRARMYSPTEGRFTTADPFGLVAGDTNLYRYASNSPLSLTDPYGLFMTCTQTRKSDGTTANVCYDSTTDSQTYYPMREPANNGNPQDPYGTGGPLPPGQYYDLLPRDRFPVGSVDKNGNYVVTPVLPPGRPLYTTPGNPAGVVTTPSGDQRDMIGPHTGSRSEGCPLFLNKQNMQQFNDAFKRNIDKGGTSVYIQSDPSSGSGTDTGQSESTPSEGGSTDSPTSPGTGDQSASDAPEQSATVIPE
jgi:RHS repeat-associated protein